MLIKRQGLEGKHFFIFAVLFAVVGGYLVFGARAEEGDPNNLGPATPNPVLSQTCGIDIALLVDMSASMDSGEVAVAKAAMKSLVTSLKDTQTYFTVSRIDTSGPAFSQDTHVVLSNIDGVKNDGGESHLKDLTWILKTDPRPNRQNLIIVLSDFELSYVTPSVKAVKQNGTRIVAIASGNGDLADDKTAIASYIAGPRKYAGNMITADIIPVKNDQIGSTYATFAKQFCKPGDTTGPGPASGPGGQGPGNQGTGPGQTGRNGGGGGGASANTVGNANNVTPSSSSQGSKEQTELKPLPFFDGKEYAPGSDPIDKALGNLSLGGKRIIHGWLYLLILFAVIGNLVAGYFLWWRRLSMNDQARWKTKLHFRT